MLENGTEQYINIYRAIVVLLSIVFIIGKPFKSSVSNSNVFASLVLLFTGLFFGLRPINVGTDTPHYADGFDRISRIQSLNDFFQEDHKDLLFNLIMYLFTRIGEVQLFFLFISLLTSCFFYHYIKLLTGKGLLFKSNLLPLFLVLMFSFPNMYCNVIRSGLAMPLMLISSYYLFERRVDKMLFWGITAVLCHQSVVIPIAFLLLITYFNKIKMLWYYILYIIVGFLSIMGVGIHNLLAGFNINRMSTYLTGGTDYSIGFRPDFFVFNTFFILVFICFRKSGIKYYDYYLKFFILNSLLFFMWFHIPYSDRIGLFSWTIIPILLVLLLQGVSIQYKRILSFLIFIGLVIVSAIL